jgi:hypothetical protein
VKATSRWIIQGNVTIATTETTRRRGTAVNVCSCTLVNVWTRLTSKLTTQALISNGALNNIASINNLRMISTVWSGPIASSSQKLLIN